MQLNFESLEAIWNLPVNVLSNIDRDVFAIVPGVLSERSRLDVLNEVERLLPEFPAGARLCREDSQPWRSHAIGRHPIVSRPRAGARRAACSLYPLQQEQ